VQIRKIVSEVKKDFKHLDHISEVDFFRVWKSFEENIDKHILNPEHLYVKFLNVGTLYLPSKFFTKVLINFKRVLVLESIKDNIDFNNIKEKALNFKKLIDKKIKNYNDVLNYLDGLENKTNVDKLHSMINTLTNIKEELNLLIKEYDKRIITRDLEEQISNS
jgi:hypothetical protein